MSPCFVIFASDVSCGKLKISEGRNDERDLWLRDMSFRSLYDKDHISELRIKNRSESYLRSCEVT